MCGSCVPRCRLNSNRGMGAPVGTSRPKSGSSLIRIVHCIDEVLVCRTTQVDMQLGDFHIGEKIRNVREPQNDF